jgi:uncharacterized membrane protein YeaQ/YmgE (transglycosylase-associated protein family)
MSLFIWIMMGIAVWHFAVFVPDRFWGGIVGAFLASIAGASVIGFVIAGFKILGRHDVSIVTPLEAIPGAVIGLAISWFYGRYVEEHGPRKRRRRRGSGPARARA